MKTSLIILFSFLFVQFSQAQETLRKKIKQLTVISTTGLNLRSEPTLESKILETVPFGKSVEILSIESFGFDTLSYHTMVWKEENDEDTSIKQYVQGYWRKVKFGKNEGFMFDSYLSFLPKVRDIHSGMNQDFILLFQSSSCYNNFYYDESFHWYGFYGNENSAEIRSTNVSFFVESFPGDPEFFESAMIISTKENKKLKFILGSKNPIERTKAHNKISFNEYYKTHLNDEKSEFLKQHGITNQKQLGHPFEYILNQNGMSQILNPKSLQLNALSHLLWVGDIDGDGKDDYIIHYGEKSGTTILYLSSAADGQIVKPVAIFYSGYCC